MINYLKRIFSNLVLTILYKPRKWTVICCLMFGLVLEKVAPWPPTLSLSSHQQEPCIILGVQWGSCFSYSDAGQETVLPLYVFLFGFSYSIASSSGFGKKTAFLSYFKGSFVEIVPWIPKLTLSWRISSHCLRDLYNLRWTAHIHLSGYKLGRLKLICSTSPKVSIWGQGCSRLTSDLGIASKHCVL